MADKLSGKASYFQFKGTRLTITKYSAKVSRDLVDTTDSDDYDAASDMVYPSQLAVKVGTEVSVEGNFKKSQTPAKLVAELYAGNAAGAAVLGLDAGALLGHGNFDLKDFECEVPITETVTWKGTLVSNGVFTPNA